MWIITEDGQQIEFAFAEDAKAWAEEKGILYIAFDKKVEADQIDFVVNALKQQTFDLGKEKN